MREFVSMLCFAYLVDSALLWLAAGFFSAWYFGTFAEASAGGWGVFISKVTAAVLLALVVRALQGRPVATLVRWMSGAVSDTFSIAQLFVAIVAGFLSVIGYTDSLDITGSPSASEQLYVGRVRSLLLVAITMGVAHMALSVVRKGSLISQINFAPWAYVVLAALACSAILIDLAIVQSFALTWPLLVALGVWGTFTALGHI